MGARILVDEGIRPDAWLFAESQARVVVSVARENLAELREIAQERELPFLEVGEVGGRLLEFGTLVGLPLDEVLDIWNGALAERLGGF
jgi:phosphoribosylformylglycinamidine (FGAM) synthase-like enzyme